MEPSFWDVVVVGGSMGGLDALARLVAQLPAAVLATLHLSPTGASIET